MGTPIAAAEMAKQFEEVEGGPSREVDPPEEPGDQHVEDRDPADPHEDRRDGGEPSGIALQIHGKHLQCVRDVGAETEPPGPRPVCQPVATDIRS